jgi:hypothetical protein
VRYIWVIMRVDILGMRNDIARSSWKRILSVVFGFVFFFVFVGFVGYGGFMIAGITRDIFSDFPEVVKSIEFNILSASSIAAFIMLFLTGIRSVYSNFYESNDLQFLMSTPLPTLSVFGTKFLKSLGTNLLSLLPLNGALWFGYGFAVKAPFVFFVTTIVVLLCVALLFTAVTSLIVMTVMRFVRSQRLKQLMTVLSLLFALIIVFVGQYMSLVSFGETEIDPMVLLESTKSWGFEQIGYMPNVWMAKSLLLFVDGYAFSFSESLLPLLVSSVLLIIVSMCLAERAFLTGWSQSRELDAGRKRTDVVLESMEKKAFSGPSGALYGVLRKDLQLLRRTPVMWYNFFVNVVIVGFMVYRISISGEIPDTEEIPFIKVFILFMVLLISASISGFAGTFSVSLEGKSWWIMQYLPIKPGAFYWAKLLYGCIPSFVVSGLILVIISFVPSIPSYPVWLCLLVLMAVLSVQMSIGLIFDIFSPNFSVSIFAESAGGGRKGVGGIKALISMAVSVLAVFLLAAIFAFPLYYANIGLTGITQITAYFIAVIMFLTVTGIINYICYFLGCKRLEKLFVGYYES